MKKNALYIKIVNCFLILFIIVTLLTALPVTYYRMSGADFTTGGVCLFKIVSGSMEPVYKTGDYVVVSETSEEELLPLDIIAFISQEDGTQGEVIVHRIVSKNPDGSFVTRGDANPVDDYRIVSAGRVVGKVVMKLPLLRYADRLFSGAASFALMIVLPLILMIVNEILRLALAAKRRGEISALIASYGLDPGDKRLFLIAQKYGEDAVRVIAGRDSARREEKT